MAGLHSSRALKEDTLEKSDISDTKQNNSSLISQEERACSNILKGMFESDIYDYKRQET